MCRFCTRIKLSMRRGTAKFSESQPAQVDEFREIMMLRLLYVMVNHFITPDLVFQFDETGIGLLSFGTQGRAPVGVSQFTLRGIGEKRNYTGCIVIDGDANLQGTSTSRGDQVAGGKCGRTAPSQSA